MSEENPTGPEDRADSVAMLEAIVLPVLEAQADGRLHEEIPKPEWGSARARYAPIEAFARTLAGLAPWIELPSTSNEEGRRRDAVADLVQRGLRHALDPASPGRLSFESDEKRQGLVEAGFVSLAILRAPGQLWERLSPEDQETLVRDLEFSRTYPPHGNNWLLFSAMVETVLGKITGRCLREPIENAVSRHMEWYAGDGTYGDGPEFHWDHYNSYVIHPMLTAVLRGCVERNDPLGDLLSIQLQRARRFAEVQERLISPEATFPVVGRSSQYRLAALQALSDAILTGDAPEALLHGGTRAAITAVARRIFHSPGTFDDRGWLEIGFVGRQPGIWEGYSNAGSLYLTTTGFLHLGLPPEHVFWTAPWAPWTQRRIWSGDPAVPGDCALKSR